MSKPLAFTHAQVRRAVEAVRGAGLQVTGVTIAPDGTITVHSGDNAPIAAPSIADDRQGARPSKKWEDAEA